MITAENSKQLQVRFETLTQSEAIPFLERMSLPEEAFVERLLLTSMVFYADHLAYKDKSGITQNDVLKIYQQDASSPNESLCSLLNFFYHRRTSKNFDASTDINEHVAQQFVDRPFTAEEYLNNILRTYQDKVAGYNTFATPKEKVTVRLLMDFAVELLGHLSDEENMNIVNLFRLKDTETREEAFSRLLNFVTGVIVEPRVE
jgi:hypothetical protein